MIRSDFSCAVQNKALFFTAVGKVRFRGRLVRFSFGPLCELGFGDVNIDEVVRAATRRIIGRVALRWDPSKVRVEIGREATGNPLPANAEEDAGA